MINGVEGPVITIPNGTDVSNVLLASDHYRSARRMMTIPDGVLVVTTAKWEVQWTPGGSWIVYSTPSPEIGGTPASVGPSLNVTEVWSELLTAFAIRVKAGANVTGDQTWNTNLSDEAY